MGADGEEETRKLSFNAWLRHGPKGLFGSNDPGMLLAIGDRVTFVTKKGPVFEADRSEIKVEWPRYEFGGDVNLTVGDKIYRLLLVRPRGGEQFDKTARENLSHAVREMVADPLWEGSSSVTGFGEMHRGRASGKDWKAYFGARPADTKSATETVNSDGALTTEGQTGASLGDHTQHNPNLTAADE